MSAQSFETPKIRNIFFGILIFVVLSFIALNFASDVVKLVGALFLIIPQKFGVVQVVDQNDIDTFSLKSSPSLVYIAYPGKYAVYAEDYDLLSITILLEDEKAPPWLKVRSKDSGETIAVIFVHRGLRPYDTPLAKGRPIFTIDVPAPGSYEFVHPSRNVSISLIPDYTTGKERALFLAYSLQILAIAVLFRVLYLSRSWRRIQRAREIQAQNRERHDELWEKLKRKGNNSL